MNENENEKRKRWTIERLVHKCLPYHEESSSAAPTDRRTVYKIVGFRFPLSRFHRVYQRTLDFFFYLFCLLCWFSLFQFAFVDSVFHVFYVNFYAGTDNYLNKTEDQIKNRNQRSRVVLSVVGFSIFSTSRNFHSGMESWTKKSVNRGGIRESKNKICFTVTGEEISSYFQH